MVLKRMVEKSTTMSHQRLSFGMDRILSPQSSNRQYYLTSGTYIYALLIGWWVGKTVVPFPGFLQEFSIIV